MKLALHHHYSPRIAEHLRRDGYDVGAAVDVGWEAEEDDALLALCARESRALLTDDVADFVVIDRRWQTEGRSRWGFIFTSDAGLPRSRHTIGRNLDALAGLLDRIPRDDALVDRIHWL